LLLLVGRVLLEGGGVSAGQVLAPSALNLFDLLEGRPLRRTVESVAPVVGLTLHAHDFLAMLSDNAGAAQGLFRMMIGSDGAADVIVAPGTGLPPARFVRGTLDAVEIATILRQTPIFARATIEELRALVSVARAERLRAGAVMLDNSTGSSTDTILELGGEFFRVRNRSLGGRIRADENDTTLFLGARFYFGASRR